jgi:uncharacterized membrane protein YoaK (UPF0700 family)
MPDDHFKGLRNKAGSGGPGEAAHQPPPRPARGRDALVVVLTLTTGAVDAVSFLRLGKVFSSVITGNLALLGVAAGQQDAMLALNAGLALAGYVCGVLAGGAFAGTPERGQPAWPVRVTFTLAVEWGVLAAFGGEWLVTGGHPAGASRLAPLLLGAAAMGMQSTAVRRLGPMSTTYLTSTLTGILTALAIRRWPAEWQRSTGVILAALTGATLGSLAALWSPGWVPAAILVPITAVLAGSAALARPRLPAVSPSLLAGRRADRFLLGANGTPPRCSADRPHSQRPVQKKAPRCRHWRPAAPQPRPTPAGIPEHRTLTSLALRAEADLACHGPPQIPGLASAPNLQRRITITAWPRGRSWPCRRFSDLACVWRWTERRPGTKR